MAQLLLSMGVLAGGGAAIFVYLLIPRESDSTYMDFTFERTFKDIKGAMIESGSGFVQLQFILIFKMSKSKMQLMNDMGH